MGGVYGAYAEDFLSTRTWMLGRGIAESGSTLK
jgi:hypothetical protein